MSLYSLGRFVPGELAVKIASDKRCSSLDSFFAPGGRHHDSDAKSIEVIAFFGLAIKSASLRHDRCFVQCVQVLPVEARWKACSLPSQLAFSGAMEKSHCRKIVTQFR